MTPMPVVLVLAAVAIVAGIVLAATGRAGELALPVPDSARYGRELVTASDLAAFRPPTALLGYSSQATDEALRRIARVVAERDAELAMLRREVAVLRARQLGSGVPDGPATAGDRVAGAAPARAGAARLDPFVALEPDRPDGPVAEDTAGRPPWDDAGWAEAGWAGGTGAAGRSGHDRTGGPPGAAADTTDE
jgi:hypothetical protein